MDTSEQTIDQRIIEAMNEHDYTYARPSRVIYLGRKEEMEYREYELRVLTFYSKPIEKNSKRTFMGKEIITVLKDSYFAIG